MDFIMQPPGLFSQKEAETRSYHSQLISHVDSVSLLCPWSTLSSKDTGCTLGATVLVAWRLGDPHLPGQKFSSILKPRRCRGEDHRGCTVEVGDGEGTGWGWGRWKAGTPPPSMETQRSSPAQNVIVSRGK